MEAARSSSRSSRLIASSRAMRSAGLFDSAATSRSRLMIRFPLLGARLAALRDRAWSMRMRRIATDAALKKAWRWA